LSHGILNEIRYPRVDHACTRDLGLIVTDGDIYFSEEKRHAHSETIQMAAGVPAHRIRNTARDGRYGIEKELFTDPAREVVLQRVRLVALEGALTDLRLYVILAPHLGNRGDGNTAWVGDYKGTPMLLAQRDNHALALACSAPWLARSVGVVGASHCWQELRTHKQLLRTYELAENGKVVVTGELDLRACGGVFEPALGFGPTAMEAGQHALLSLLRDFETTRNDYVEAWEAWHATLGDGSPRSPLYQRSATVLRAHESKGIEGGVIASLSIPWGFSKGDDDLGGYHLMWPRDLVQIAGGFLAVGARDAARRVLRYLQVTQEHDGHWAQNMWLDGTPYWQGIQMDETAALRSSWSISPGGRARSTSATEQGSGRWCAVRPRSSRARDRGVPRIAWRRNPDTLRSRSRPKSPPSSSPPRSRTPPVKRSPQHFCAKQPMRGTPASSVGCTSRARRWRRSTASTATTSVSVL
jgi:glucoamylase